MPGQLAKEHATWCRLNECLAGLLATVEGERIVALRADTENVTGRHGTCGLCTASAGAAQDPRRLLRPRKRVNGRLEEVSWEVAINEIGARLKEIRKQSGPRAIGLYAGAPVGLDSRGLARTIATTLGLGTPNLYSPLASRGGPWLRAVELVVGHAAALQRDVGRAHYVILLGANQEADGWGPLQGGRNLGADLAFSRKTKGTKVIAVDPRKTPLAAGADLHLPIRPGTELFFVLGMIDAILKNDWRDTQYTNDYCTPLGPLKEALAAWPVETCAAICGIPATDIGGVALKFSRAAMAVCAPGNQALQSEHGTLTAWALLVLHALTANLLRPGGLFDNKGVIDVHPLAKQLPTDAAPRTRVGDYPLLLLQAPSALLADEILTPGEGQVRALVSLYGDPARELPGGPRLREALGALDLLVAVDLADTDTTELAHWVLPATHPWEREDLHLHDTSILPWRFSQHTAALVPPPGEARDLADILRDLFKKVGPTLRGGEFGAHLRVLGSFVATADLAKWEARLLDTSGVVSMAELEEAPHGWFSGEVDRATWRLTTASGRFELLPAPIAAALARVVAPSAPAGLDRWLLTSAARDAALRPFDRPVGLDPAAIDPGVTLHPASGFAEGARVRIRTTSGAVEATVHLDATLREDVVDLPAGHVVDAMALLPTDRLDPLTGTPAANGLPCVVEPL
ncbi:MAG: molybdopterin-dependent oxidoreductase [Pseudomonadota bacterium]|nr:molybdopterin-dependent oxidoreductase [Pseudomonadota bacterium]